MKHLLHAKHCSVCYGYDWEQTDKNPAFVVYSKGRQKYI